MHHYRPVVRKTVHLSLPITNKTKSQLFIACAYSQFYCSPHRLYPGAFLLRSCVCFVVAGPSEASFLIKLVMNASPLFSACDPRLQLLPCFQVVPRRSLKRA